jgi:hypothetical protein
MLITPDLRPGMKLMAVEGACVDETAEQRADVAMQRRA